MPAVIEQLGISSTVDEDITIDGIQSMDGSSSRHFAADVGVRGGSLLVGVTAGILLKGEWNDQESVAATTQVTVLSRQASGRW